MTVSCGAYGKMPGAGDFLRIGLPPTFVDPWDAWIQSLMLSGQQAFGGQWDALYMTTPIWRFTLASGLAGPAAMVGVVMPSVDRVGRRFPLTLVRPLGAGQSAGAAHFANTAYFERLETVVLGALDDDMTPDRLRDNLAALPVPAAPATAKVWKAGPATLVAGGPGAASDLAAKGIGADRAGQSLWSCDVDGQTRMMVFAGLPPPNTVTAFADLQARAWQHEAYA